MEFATPAVKTVYEKVDAWMKEMFGELVQPSADSPGWGIRFGSAWVRTWISQWGDDDAVITSRSWLVTKAELTQELCKYLLVENDSMRFGAFGIDKDDDIFFEHAIPGMTAQKEELKASLMAVARVADNYDEQIVARFGGQRFTDR